MRSRKPLVALLCVLLVASAGCSALGGSDGQPTTVVTDTTATEQPTTTGTPTTTGEPQFIAPGVTLEDVTDPLALANAHREQLRAGTWVATDTYRRTNGTATVTRRTTVHYRNESRWRWNRTTEGLPTALGVSNGSFVQYADGEQVVWRLAARGNVSYGLRSFAEDGERVATPPDRVFPEWLYARDFLYSLLANANTTADTVEGATAYVEGSAGEMQIGGERATDVSFQAAFDNSGRLLRLELTYERGNATVHRRLEFDDVDTDPVERPEWYGTALNRTNATAAG